MTSELTSWTKVAQPHADIADGSFDESLFAADLGSVARGRGPADYVDPVRFCEKTYLTANLSTVLTGLARRLSGDASASSIHRLQTDFGGGKTHTLLAAYHLFAQPDEVAGTSLAQGLSAEVGGGRVPQARVAVLDGSDLAVTPEDADDQRRLHTLVGHLAWRLGGPRAYDRVAESDQARAGTSTHELVELLEAHAPCLVLLDEMLAYLNNALSVSTHEGNLASTTLTIIKSLTQAGAQVPGVAVLATLTSSRMEDYAEVAGTEMSERLGRVVGRSENIVTPVEGDDIFPILHRRLFASVGSDEHRRAIADAYGDHYDALGDVLPSTFRERHYRDRIARAYPFHPELVDLCTNRWGSLSGFQRTRGALRILAHTVKALARRDHDGPLIHLGDLPLDDDAVRAEVLRFAGESYKSALNADIIRPDSKAPQEDQRRGGQAGQTRLATALATTAFANSFSADRVVGASAAQMIIGTTRPGVSRGVLDDVRDALEGALWYMRLEGGRYRFTTEPNLNKVIVEREAAIHEYDIARLIREGIRTGSPAGYGFRVVHDVTEPSALPDDGRLTLGILDPDLRLGESDSLSTASEILTTKGAGWRAQLNAVVLVAADARALATARATARTLAAMRDLLDDRHRLARFNNEQKEQLRKRASDAEQRLPQQVIMAYRHLLAPRDANGEGLKIDSSDLGPARAGTTITERVAAHLKEADRLIEDQLAPAALLSDRFAVLPAGHDAVELDRLLAYFAQYPRLPKLTSDKVLRRALAGGAKSGQFALASGTSWDAEDALIRFHEPVDPDEIAFQPGTWLVRAGAAQALLDRRRTAERHEDERREALSHSTEDTTGAGGSSTTTQPGADTGGDRDDGDRGDDDRRGRPSDTLPGVTITVRGVPGEQMREVVKSAVLPLAGSADVSVDMRITATGSQQGIPRQTLDLVVKEALRQLGLNDTDVEEHSDS